MKYGDISLVLCISTRLRLVTILSLLVKYLVIFHVDPCNKSYIYISREISIEHPSVGLASLAQLPVSLVGALQPLDLALDSGRLPAAKETYHTAGRKDCWLWEL